MSDKTTNPTVHTVTSLENDQEEKVTKQSKIRNFGRAVKNNPKTTLAVVGLGALVVVSAVSGRKTAKATVSVQSPLVIEDAGVVEGEIVESTDTQSA